MISIAIRSWAVSTKGTTGRRGQRNRIQVADHARLDCLRHVVTRPPDLDDRAVLARRSARRIAARTPIRHCRRSRCSFSSRERSERLHRLPQVAHNRQARLAVADHEQIDEWCEQLRVLRPRAARDHQRVIGAAIFGVKRQAPQVEHREHVRVTDLVLEREPQDVEPAERCECLETVERQPRILEPELEIRQRRERSLTRPARLIHQAVQDLKTVMAHSERIGVGERQANGSAGGLVVLGDAVQLAADVLGGGSDPGQDPREDLFFQILIQHAVARPNRCLAAYKLHLTRPRALKTVTPRIEHPA